MGKRGVGTQLQVEWFGVGRLGQIREGGDTSNEDIVHSREFSI
jgi:hypothetical protein